LVETDAAEATARTEVSASVSPTSTVPLTSVKRPRTLATMRWRATKPTSAWVGSTVHVPAVSPGKAVMMVLSGGGRRAAVDQANKIELSTIPRSLRCLTIWT